MLSKLNDLRTYIRGQWVGLMAHFHDSETRFLAWVMSLSGIAMAMLGAMDFGSILSDALTRKQQIAIGLSMAAKGALDYISRTYREVVDKIEDKPNA